MTSVYTLDLPVCDRVETNLIFTEHCYLNLLFVPSSQELRHYNVGFGHLQYTVHLLLFIDKINDNDKHIYQGKLAKWNNKK